jgi:hypothetical protein
VAGAGATAGGGHQHEAISASNSARTSSPSPLTRSANASSNQRSPSGDSAVRSHTVRLVIAITTRPGPRHLTPLVRRADGGQASIAFCSAVSSRPPIAILRGLARSAMGMRNSSTPLS